MRDIKFRAWLEQEKKMYEVTAIRLGMQHGMSRIDIVNYVDLRDKSKLYIDGRDVELMQYTGIKDYTGQEIYEGDIMLYTGAPRGIVTWIEVPSPGFIIKAKDDLFPLLRSWSVIGNIYEHPELLVKEENVD